MKTTKVNYKRNDRKSNSEMKPVFLNSTNYKLETDKKYEMLGKLRIQLGKSKEEFHRLFELYNQLVTQKNA
jgi:hypothetical protein